MGNMATIPFRPSDAEWTLLEPLRVSPERRVVARRHGPCAASPMDAVFFYLLRSGCVWGTLPREYPPWQTVYYHFRKWWRLDGRLQQAHDRLRTAVREAEGKARDPSEAILGNRP